MALRNAFENLGLDSTLQSILSKLPAALGGNGGLKVEQQGPIDAKLQDGLGNAISSTSAALDVNIKSGGSPGSTQYAEGATAATATGTLALGKNGTALKAAQTDSSGNLRVDLSQTSANATAIKVDGSGVTQPVSGTFWQATQPVSGTVTANQGGTWDVRNVSGTVSLPTGAATAAKQPALGTAGTPSADVLTVQGATSMTPLKVDNSGITQPVSGTVAATQSGTWTVQPGNTANTTAWKVDGSAVTQPVSAAALPLPALAATSTKQSDGSQKTQVVDGSGNVVGATSNALDINIKSGNPTTMAVTESGTWNVGSSTATGAAVPANAFYHGLNAQTALPTAATPGNLTGATADKFGRTVVLPNAMRDIMGTQTTTISASTAETTIISQVASTFLDLVSVFISNTSTTAARVDIRDTTGGSVIFQLYIPAGDMRGFSLATPWPQTSVNTNWTAQSSVSVTDLRVSALFIKNK